MKAGRNLEISLTNIRPDLEFRHENIFDFSGAAQRLIMEKGWGALSGFRPARDLCTDLYRLAIASDKFASVFALVQAAVARRLERFYSAAPLVSVIALHPGASAACVQWKKCRSFHLFSVATDLVVHSMQAYREVDAIYADPKAVLMSPLVRRARDEGRIKFLGLPVENLHFDRAALSSSKTHTVLISFGATGVLGSRSVGWIFRAVREFPESRFEFVCGSNRGLYRHVTRRVLAEGLQDRVIVHAFVDDMPRRISEADVLVGKPGGITAGEAFAQNKPLIIVDMLPGQEWYNHEVLVRNGLGFRATCAEDLIRLIRGISGREDEAVISRLAISDTAGIDAIARSIGQMLPFSMDQNVRLTCR